MAKLGFAAAPVDGHWEISLKDGQSIDPVVDLLRARGLSIRHLVEKRETLEDIFIATVQSAEPGVDHRAARKPETRIKP